jgi:hypothetical protein
MTLRIEAANQCDMLLTIPKDTFVSFILQNGECRKLLCLSRAAILTESAIKRLRRQTATLFLRRLRLPSSNGC